MLDWKQLLRESCLRAGRCFFDAATQANPRPATLISRLPTSSVSVLLQWKIPHLDGRDIVIKTRPGQIIDCEVKDEETGRTLPYITVIPTEGMPSQGNPFVRGNLYVAFHVKFPKTLPPDVIAQLNQLLPDADMPVDFDPETTEEHFMEEADLRHFGKGGAARAANEYDSDDDEGGGGQQGVLCQQS